MGAETEERHPAGDQDLGGDHRLLSAVIAFLRALEVLDGLDGVLARPAERAQYGVEPVGVSARVGVGDHLAPAASPVPRRVGDTPFDQFRRERLRQRGQPVAHFLGSERLRHSARCNRYGIGQRPSGRRRPFPLVCIMFTLLSVVL